ncbi:MAG: VCBS repeat-containing protein, partial [Chitinophagales bacterium]|nr:VCBS repeat-containing protein [Chitinophagales bacterium]
MRLQIIIIQGIILFILFSTFSCQQDNKSIDPNAEMFKSLPAYNTGVDFNNEVTATLQFNHFFWQSIYNGAGVGIGDVNNDGLPDLFFTGNTERDRLYLNKGNFKFEDVTLKAGIKDDGFWSTGVTMGDVNNDGHLDIYVCRHGPYL